MFFSSSSKIKSKKVKPLSKALFHGFALNRIFMRPIDFIIYYCMQQFKTGNLNYTTPLGRACGVVGFIIGILILIIVELILRLSANYKIIEHQFPFTITGIAVFLLPGSVFYYIYHNKKRFKFIQSSEYIPFKFTNTTGYTVSIVAFLLSFFLLCVATIYINDYL